MSFSGDKGKRGEREVIAILQPICDAVADACGQKRPKLQRNLMQADGGGFDITDVTTRWMDWIAIEVKWHEADAVWKWWQQALKQAGETRAPVLFYRSNKTTWKVMTLGYLGGVAGFRTVPVTVRADDFCDWFRARLAQEMA